MSNAEYSFDEVIDHVSHQAGWITVIIAAICMIFFFVAPVHAAITDKTTFTTVYQGLTPIKDLTATKAPSEMTATTARVVETKMKLSTYPYDVAKPVTVKTDIKIIKMCYDAKKETNGYWIEAYRNGQEVAVNNPIWVKPAPTDVLVSESLDEVKNELTVTLKEDPKAAIEEILQRHADGVGLGRAVTGTKGC